MNSYLPNTVAELVEILQLIPHPEGGFFREVYRSGSEPMASRGLTDTTTATYDASRSLVRVAAIRNVDEKPISSNEKMNAVTDVLPTDTDFVVRNALTSIYWVPTIKSSKLFLATNLSDHVHYYQGGGYAFKYYIYSPRTGMFRTEILGPNLMKGHKLQVAVCNREWKCGHLVSLESALDENEDIDGSTAPSTCAHPDKATHEYAIIAEGVGPGFDIHDFSWITEDDINQSNLSLSQKSRLKQYVHDDATVVSNKDEDFDQHYDKNDATDRRMKERA